LNNNFELESSTGSQLSLGNSTNIGGGSQTGFSIRKNSFTKNRLSIAKYTNGNYSNLYLTLTNNVKIAIKWNGVTADIFVNGVIVVESTSFNFTVLEFISSYSTVEVPKYIKSTMLFPKPLTNAQLITLTTL
jgi:hypothetical protein